MRKWDRITSGQRTLGCWEENEVLDCIDRVYKKEIKAKLDCQEKYKGSWELQTTEDFENCSENIVQEETGKREEAFIVSMLTVISVMSTL